jgi:hypothetical protein
LSLVYPATLDGGLLLADRALGESPSFTVGRVVQGSKLLRRLVDVVYVELPFAYVVVSLATAKQSGKSHALLRDFALYGGASFLLLPLVPACGPVYAFEDFPNVLPHVTSSWTTVPASAYRNCVPSMHTTWALLLFMRAQRGHAWVRLFAAFWLVFTLLATLGKGEHYALDLVVAFPFLLALESVRTRGIGLGVGLVLIFTWLVTLRFGLASIIANPHATLICAVATVAVSAVLLARAQLSPSRLLVPASE